MPFYSFDSSKGRSRIYLGVKKISWAASLETVDQFLSTRLIEKTTLIPIADASPGAYCFFGNKFG